MTIGDILARLQKGIAGKEFDGSLKFDCAEDGVIVLENGAADDQDRDTDCTIAISTANLAKLLQGKLNPMTGVMMGKLKVTGNMGVAMGLGKLLK